MEELLPRRAAATHPFRPAALRAARRAALVALSLALAYLVAVNVLLGTGLLRRVLGLDPDAMTVEYARAWSLVPWRVRVEGLSIAGKDTHVEWSLAVDRCDFRPSFAALLHRRFRATRVRAEGVSMRLRQRVASLDGEKAAALPAIPHRADPPLADIGPPAPPPTDAQYDLWSISLDDVVARHVREVWIDELRVSGDATVRGRWDFTPLRRLEIGPADVELHEMTVAEGELSTWARRVDGELRVTVGATDLRPNDDAALLHQLSISGDAGGMLLAGHLLRNIPELRLEAAPVRAHIEVDHGVVSPGTEVSVTRLPAKARIRGLDIAGAATARLLVDEHGVAHWDLDADGVRVTRDRETQVRAARARISAESRHLDLASPLADPPRSLAVDVPQVRVRLEGKELEGKLAAHVRAAPGRLDARVVATAKDAEPLAALVARASGIPKWAVDAISTKNLTAEGYIAVGGDTLAVRSAHARAEGVVVDFELGKRGARQDWAALIRAKKLVVGVAEAAGKTDVKLAGAETWFGERVAAIRGVEAGR